MKDMWHVSENLQFDKLLKKPIITNHYALQWFIK